MLSSNKREIPKETKSIATSNSKTPYSEANNRKRYSIDKISPFMSSKLMKNSASKGDLSTNYSKNVMKTSRIMNKTNDIIQTKNLARETMHNMNSPNKSLITLSPRRFRDTTVNDIADETAVNFNRCFMDEYYASNGYFSFSANREQMRGKDSLYDKLQTFVDERLLEVASQISVKKRSEELKEKNIDKLATLKDDIGMILVFIV